MLVKCSVNGLENKDISHSIPLVPRLEYSVNLLDEMTRILGCKRDSLKQSNRSLNACFDETDRTHMEALLEEQTVFFSCEVLLQAKKRIARISGVDSIPKVMPLAISLVRTVSARLYDVDPRCSRKLAELSVHLGSIVLDSAALTEARFDFGLSNDESASMLDKVKLMVDSKLCKQYPNLDFLKPCTV